MSKNEKQASAKQMTPEQRESYANYELVKQTLPIINRFINPEILKDTEAAWKLYAEHAQKSAMGDVFKYVFTVYLKRNTPTGEWCKRLEQAKVARRSASRWAQRGEKIIADRKLANKMALDAPALVMELEEEFNGDAEAEKIKEKIRHSEAEAQAEKDKADRLREKKDEAEAKAAKAEAENEALKAEIAGLKALKAGDDDTFAKMLNEMLAAPALRLADRFIEYLDEPQTTMRGRIEYMAVGRTLAFTINHLNYVFDLFLRRGSFDAADFHVNQHIKDVVEKLMNLQGFREDMAILENTSRASVFAPVVGEEAAARMDAAAAGRKEKPAEK